MGPFFGSALAVGVEGGTLKRCLSAKATDSNGKGVDAATYGLV